MNIPISKLITIVIPVLNEEDYLPLLLRDLAKQENVCNLKVIIADGGSTDSTLYRVNNLSKIYTNLNIQIIKGGTVSQGRNAGLKNVNTPYVIFIDSDAKIPNNQTINKTVKLLRKYNLVGSYLRSTNWNLSIVAYSLFNGINKLISLFRPFAVGSYFAVSTERIKKIGGFREDVIHSEDWLASANFFSHEFYMLPYKYSIYVDDRRFKRTGYFGMLKVLFSSVLWGEKYMKIDNGYWKNN